MSTSINLQQIITACEKQFDRGLAENWKHSDFLALHREVLKSTKVNISPSTLKRIFGKVSVEDDYIPQQATLDALISYGGSVIINPDPEVVNHPEQKTDRKSALRTSIKYVVFGTITTIIVVLFLRNVNTDSNETGTLKLTGMEGVLPSTAFFEVGTPIKNDSVFIDFGDRSALASLKKEQTHITHNYLIPGVFEVRLFTANRTLATTRVFVKSNKWIGLGFRRQREVPAHYYAFPAIKSGKDSLFHISNRQLKSKGVDTTGSLFTRLCNYAKVGASGDDFVFNTTFKNNIGNMGIYCHATQLKISGLNGMIKFRFVNSGCSEKAEYVMGEQSYVGSTRNLSGLVLNLKQWNSLKLINHQKQVSLFVNDKLIFTGNYQKTIGDIRGVFVEFEGNGFIKTCQLSSPNGREIFRF